MPPVSRADGVSAFLFAQKSPRESLKQLPDKPESLREGLKPSPGKPKPIRAGPKPSPDKEKRLVEGAMSIILRLSELSENLL